MPPRDGATASDLRLPALRRFAVAITILNLLGHFVLGFEQSWAQPLIAMATAYSMELALEAIGAWADRRTPAFRGGWCALLDFLLPAHITALAVSMLLYANDRLMVIAFATAVGIGSKALIRVPVGGGRVRHCLNPSNTGIALTLLLFPWVGIAPPYQFTENLVGIGDWLLPGIIVMSGTFLNTRFTRRVPLILAWLGGFVLQAMARSLIQGTPTTGAILPVTGVAFLLFTFYMATDPATTPSGILGQFAFGAAAGRDLRPPDGGARGLRPVLLAAAGLLGPRSGAGGAGLGSQPVADARRPADPGPRLHRPLARAGRRRMKSPSIAMVGLACEYPGADSPAELWENVLAGRRAFRRIPPERLRIEDYGSSDPSAPDRTYAVEAALIEGYAFDRVGFRVSGSSYRSADMAHWMALDVAARALVDAGFEGGDGLPRETTGVFLGNTLTGEFSRADTLRLRWPYARRVVDATLRDEGWSASQRAGFLERLEASYKSPFPPAGEETLAGGLSNTIAGRICNHFDFNGGGYTVDGACASSLLAVAHACSSLAAGDPDAAMAGGVDLSLDPFELVGFAKAGALAHGEMRVYDRRSAGFLPGEGCGVVVLMRQEDAEAMGLRVLAVIRGWGISSDGRGGLTRPEVEGQLLALRRAYRRAGFPISTVSYFEGHGTGTAVGDAAEFGCADPRPPRVRLQSPDGYDRVDQGEHRSHQGGGGRRRADQGGTGPRRPDPAADDRLRATPRPPERGRQPTPHSGERRAVAGRPAIAGGHQRHGIRRDQRPCRPRVA